MTAPIYLLLVFHNHQPVGQFDHVNEHSTNVSYVPLIELLERHPTVKIGLHYSGPLLEWLNNHHTDMIDRLRVLVARGQVEMISGGYYEPVLPALPDEDKIGQIEKLSTELHTVFGSNPSGMLLAERVWEPYLARPIVQAGIRYTALDDSHFETVGLNRDNDLFGYYMTEEQGDALAVFPALTYLRQAIPWHPIDALIDWLRMEADQPLASLQPKMVFMSEDGEKFGTWPGTYELCWGDGKYMDGLFSALEKNIDWLKTATPSEFMATSPAIGRIYLPAISYEEMGEWSLPASVAHQLTEVRRRLELEYRPEVLRFLHGGLWRNFMVKYDEINHMHKRMLMVSQKVHAMRRGRKRDQALDLLWASQGNDPYWHGVFGGIYLFNFRAAAYQYLLAAENAADDAEEAPITLLRMDFDRDSREDVIVMGGALNAFWDPALGGALLELDYRPAQYNLYNVVTRRREGYHSDLLAAVGDGSIITPLSSASAEVDTSSRAVRAKEPGLEKLLIYDWHRRASFLDHFVAPSTTYDEFYHAQYAEQGDFVNQPYQVLDASANGTGTTVQMRREGHVWIGDVLQPVTITKTFYLNGDEATLRVIYTLSHAATVSLDVRFGIETVVGLDGGQDLNYCALRINDSPERESLAGLHEIEAVTSHAADSTLRNLTLRTNLSKPAFLWQFPLETITLSDAGFERDYQGTVFLHLWNIRLAPGETWQVVITQSVQQTATRP